MRKPNDPVQTFLKQAYRRGVRALADHGEEWLQAAVTAFNNRGYGHTPAEEDPYLVLGVEPSYPQDLIDQVYRTKAKAFHPDNRQTGSPAAFARIKGAYDLICALRAAATDPLEEDNDGE